MKKNQLSILAIMLFMLTTLTSCEAIASIFKAGMWSGIIIVVIVLAIIVFVISKASGKK